uniref:Uncharacterized protein n=2 Tax=Panagrolaimus sp. JU765 TaxID=591449 RepID=A0AC34R0P2_9BILA
MTSASVVLTLFVLIFVVSVKSQYAAWPATSYSPFFDALFKAAASPVISAPSGPGLQAPAIPMHAPTTYAFAAPPVAMAAPPIAMAAPTPMAFAAPPRLLAPPAYVPAFAAPAYYASPAVIAPAAAFVPKVIPAPYGPFGRPAVAYGSNKN